MFERVAATIRRHQMFSPGDKIAVTVSGGADSVCLLYVLRELNPEQPLLVVHINHRLRAAESDADEAFVRGLAADLGLPCSVESVDIAALPGNLEENAREARLASFCRLVREGLVDRVATGHTASDQAETVLFRLLRGTGPDGLAGIRPAIPELGLIRPLLECTRQEVRDWLRSAGRAWCEDRSNADLEFSRNRIRNCLIPQLEQEYNPRIGFVLSQTARLACEDEAFWRQEIEHRAATGFVRSGGAVIAGLASFCSRQPAVSRRLIRRAFAEVRGDLRSLTFDHVERVLRLIERPEGHGTVSAPGVCVTRSFEWVRFAAGTLAAASPDVARPISLKIQEISPENATMEGNCLDADLLCGGWQSRAWRPGDRLSGRKLKHWFHQARIPLWERRGWPVLEAAGTLIWARKFGVARELAVTPQTRRALRIEEIESS